MAVVDDARRVGGAATTSPSRATVSPSRRNTSATASALSAATTTIMPTPQLNVRSISGSAMPPVAASQRNTRQHRHAREIDAHAESVGQHARNVLGEAAAGDVRERLDAAGLADRREARAHIDARRRQHRFAQGHAGCERAGRIPAQPGLLHHLAGERIAVRVQAGRREAEHHVARRDAARQHRVALDRADRKAREIVVAAPCRGPGISAVSPPISAQRASRQPAAIPFTTSRADIAARACRRRNSRERTAARRPAPRDR